MRFFSFSQQSRVGSENYTLVPTLPSMITFDSSPDDYEKWQNLSRVCNGFGDVWIARHRPSSRQVIIKNYDLEKCHSELELIQHEISTVKKLKHPNIIDYYMTFTACHQLWIVMPLLGYTSASRLVGSHFPEGLCESALVLIIKDVVMALIYLHSKAITHRAVKGSHILIDETGRCVLSGFRHSVCTMSGGQHQRVIYEYPAQAYLNLNWASPELLSQDVNGYSEKTDIYSLGIVICELANGIPPFSRMDPGKILLEKFEGPDPYLYDATTVSQLPEVNPGIATDSGFGASVGSNMLALAVAERVFSKAMHHFTQLLLSKCPNDRPTSSQLLHHEWIRYARKIPQTIPELLEPASPIVEQTEAADYLTDFDISLDRLNPEEEVTWDF